MPRPRMRAYDAKTGEPFIDETTERHVNGQAVMFCWVERDATKGDEGLIRVAFLRNGVTMREADVKPSYMGAVLR